MGTVSEVILSSAGDTTLNGQVSAIHLIQVNAGTDGSGSIIGGLNTDLTTTGSNIVLTSGTTSGDITLTASAINSSTSTGMISLNSPGGQVAQTGGVITGGRGRCMSWAR